jgi:hypothetical protein
LDEHQGAAFKTVANEALAELDQVKELWRECLNSRRDKLRKSRLSEHRLPAVEEDKSA